MTARALYDYAAAEADELSFGEGDTLVNCEQVDDGWMMGTNPKTGASGLLPSNYVEIINWEIRFLFRNWSTETNVSI